MQVFLKKKMSFNIQSRNKRKYIKTGEKKYMDELDKNFMTFDHEKTELDIEITQLWGSCYIEYYAIGEPC